MSEEISFRIQNAAIHWLEDDVPRSSQYDDVYFSTPDESGESRHVFLTGNQLAQRWREHTRCFTIAELGFGAGLNLLETWRLWLDCPAKPPLLHYIAWEAHPLTRADLARVQRRWPEHGELAQRLLVQYPDHSRGCHRLWLAEDLLVDLHLEHAAPALEDMSAAARGRVDAWFMDGFKPAHNPALWDGGLLVSMTNASAPGATLASYSVAGPLRRRLSQLGWQLQRLPGFGRKRHMLTGHLAPGHSPCAEESTRPVGSNGRPSPASSHSAPRQAVVIGAGLAGCSMAYSLARRGWRVKVLECGEQFACGASGISQLALRCRLFQAPDAGARFFLHAYLLARRQFESLSETGLLAWHPVGSIQLQGATNRRKTLNVAKLAALYPDQVVTPHSRESLSDLAATQVTHEGLYFALAGWIDPRSLCNCYLKQDSIQLRTGVSVRELARRADEWQVLTDDGTVIEQAAVVVIAAGPASASFAQSRHLPLVPAHGQATVAESASGFRPRCVISGARTVFPAREQLHTLSASYSDKRIATEELAAHDEHNLAAVAACFTAAEGIALNAVGQQLATRANTLDHLPLVGALLDHEAVLSSVASGERDYQELCHPGLFISSGHGSSGLASAPLSAEYLASLINSEVLPVGADVVSALDPGRFLRRQLRRR